MTFADFTQRDDTTLLLWLQLLTSCLQSKVHTLDKTQRKYFYLSGIQKRTTSKGLLVTMPVGPFSVNPQTQKEKQTYLK